MPRFAPFLHGVFAMTETKSNNGNQLSAAELRSQAPAPTNNELAEIDPRRDPVAWARANCRPTDTTRTLKCKGSISVATLTLRGTFAPTAEGISEQILSQDADKGIPCAAPPFGISDRLEAKDKHVLTPEAAHSLLEAML
jgi:hypothetical protein